MKKLVAIAVLVLFCVAVWAQGEPGFQEPQATNVAVTEVRVDQPFVIDWAKVTSLATRIFAEPWIRSCRPEWNGSYPSPARITTTYGKPAAGDSLTPVNDTSCQRPCWVFWKDDRSGVAVEKGINGNWIVSTFVRDDIIVINNTTTVTQVELVPVPELVTRTRTEIIEVPYRVPVNICPSPRYVPGVAVAANMDNGGLSFAGVHATDRVQIGSIWAARQNYRTSATCPTPPPPDDGTCGPGTPPTPPPPNDPGVIAPPGNPSGQVPCPPPSDPNAPPAQPDHDTGGQPWEPMPDSPTVADPVVPEGAPGDSTAQ